MPTKKTALEQRITDLLTGETQALAFDFVNFLKANKIPKNLYVISVVGDGGNFPHIRPWVIFFNVSNFDGASNMDEDLRDFAHKYAHICDHFITDGARCGCGKQPGTKQTVFGREFDNICRCPMQFINPDAAALSNMKELLLLLKQNSTTNG